MSSMKNPLIVSSPGGEMKTGYIFPQVKINIIEVDFLANLVVLKSWGIDVILVIDCEDHVWFEDRWMVASLCDE
jgi:hypothetical protein